MPLCQWKLESLRLRPEAGGGTAGFSASGTAYVRFALANPALFRMIFANPGARTAAERDDDAIAMLRDNAATLAAGNGGSAEVVMLKAWALAHGLAMLMLDQQVPADDKFSMTSSPPQGFNRWPTRSRSSDPASPSSP